MSTCTRVAHRRKRDDSAARVCPIGQCISICIFILATTRTTIVLQSEREGKEKRSSATTPDAVAPHRTPCLLYLPRLVASITLASLLRLHLGLFAFTGFAAAICSFDLWPRQTGHCQGRAGQCQGENRGKRQLQRGNIIIMMMMIIIVIIASSTVYATLLPVQHCRKSLQVLQVAARACAKERIKRINKRIQIKFLIKELPLNLYINYNFYSWRLCFVYDDADDDDKAKRGSATKKTTLSPLLLSLASPSLSLLGGNFNDPLHFFYIILLTWLHCCIWVPIPDFWLCLELCEIARFLLSHSMLQEDDVCVCVCL